MATVFQLHTPNSAWMPADASDRLTVGIRLGRHGYAIDGSILIGPLMASAREIDATVDSLIAELESIRAMAKQELDELS